MYSRICNVLLSVLLALSIFNVGSISVKAEAVYNVGLEIETAEMPINWIQEGDGASLQVKIKNNPGVDELLFCYKTDDKIKDEPYSFMSTKGEYPTWVVSTFFFHDPFQTYRIEIFNRDWNSTEKYYANGDICYITVYVDPDKVQIGDFYPVEFITEPIDHDYDIGFEIDGTFYDYENITEYINGGIRVVGPRLKYTPVDGNSAIEEQQVQSQQPEEVEPQAEIQNNDSNVPSSENIQSELSQPPSDTIITTNETTLSNTETKITTKASKNVTSEKKISESSVSVTEEVVESSADDYITAVPEKKNVIPVIVSSILILAAVTVILLIRKIKRKRIDKMKIIR